MPSDSCFGAGRWVRCSAAGIHPQNCLRDGWVFVPLNCKYSVVSPIEIMQLVASIRPQESRPLWIAMLGSSIERETIHNLLDLVGGVRADPESDDLVRDKDKVEIKSVREGNGVGRGQGSIMNCWGWADIQLGSLRLSYPDFRAAYLFDPSYYPQAL